MPKGFSVRNPKLNELDAWKRMPFDDNETAERYMGYMTDYFNRVYAPEGSLFFKTCCFAVDQNDVPVGTCFTWKTYGRFTTMHWLKVVKQYESLGIGRALLSHVLRQLSPEDYPIFLHTQTGSFRAIKLYTDFGFKILKDELIGQRQNQIEAGLPLLKKYMPSEAYENLKFEYAPQAFLEEAAKRDTNDF
ncbi:MAG: GNAT family N-acetyltransferase [Clostridiales bacterium]|nr:GNAT family N-acetyltransferase [Clostridiales bacterium]